MVEDCPHFKSKTPGVVIAKVLSGAWREYAAAPHLSKAELSLVAPLIYQSGDAGLAWWRIRTSSLARSPMGRLLHDAYRHLRLAARAHEREIKEVISFLREEGIEPVLVKGWAIARRYPDFGLRPYGDIDLCVRPDQFNKAERMLTRLAGGKGHFVDLHDGFSKLDLVQVKFRSRRGQTLWDELFERSRLVDCGAEKVRVLSDEDHLRVLCLHLLRSGAWRLLWLCDVALAVESGGPDFDWGICLGSDLLKADWIACIIGVAHHLLKADLAKTPLAERATNLPRWLIPAVLRQWDRCRNPDSVGIGAAVSNRRHPGVGENLQGVVRALGQSCAFHCRFARAIQRFPPLAISICGTDHAQLRNSETTAVSAQAVPARGVPSARGTRTASA
jgi:hypothetical protein